LGFWAGWTFWQEAAAANRLDSQMQSLQQSNAGLVQANQRLNQQIVAASTQPVIEKLAQVYGWVSPHEHIVVIEPPSPPPGAQAHPRPTVHVKIVLVPKPWWAALWEAATGQSG
jgi:hypothetical protein